MSLLYLVSETVEQNIFHINGFLEKFCWIYVGEALIIFEKIQRDLFGLMETNAFSISSTKVLNIVMILYLIAGPVVFIVEEDIPLLPKNFLICLLSVSIISNTKFVERMIGSLRALLLVIVSYVVDYFLRIPLSHLKSHKKRIRFDTIPTSTSVLTTFALFYCIMFPSSINSFIPISNKVILICQLFLVVGLDFPSGLISFFAGFILFVFSSPFIFHPQNTTDFGQKSKKE